MLSFGIVKFINNLSQYWEAVEVENYIWNSNDKEGLTHRFWSQFHRYNWNSLGVNVINLNKERKKQRQRGTRAKLGEYLTLRCGGAQKRSQLKIQKKISKIVNRTNRLVKTQKKKAKVWWEIIGQQYEWLQRVWTSFAWYYGVFKSFYPHWRISSGSPFNEFHCQDTILSPEG